MSEDGVYRVTFSKFGDDLEISAASITAYTQTERDAVIDKAEAVAASFDKAKGGRRRRNRKTRKSKKSKRKGTTRRR